MKKLNTKGFAHIAALAIVVVGVAAFGTYMLVASHAATCKDYVYGKGGSGQCVKNIQLMMNEQTLQFGRPSQPACGGHYITATLISVDGSYGPATIAKVKNAQSSIYCLKADGIVGPATWKLLCSYSALGYERTSANAAIRAGYAAAINSGCPADKTVYNN